MVRKTASWGQNWTGLKHWETSDRFWVKCTINGVDIITKNERWSKRRTYQKRKLWDKKKKHVRNTKKTLLTRILTCTRQEWRTLIFFVFYYYLITCFSNKYFQSIFLIWSISVLTTLMHLADLWGPTSLRDT